MGSATIAALGGAVNTLLTPTTMGGEKFHITVTIDNEKALQIADFLHFPASRTLLLWDKIYDHEFGPRSNALNPGMAIRPAIFLSRSTIKAADVIGFLSADICVDALAL